MLSEDHFLSLVAINVLGVVGIVVWHAQGRNRPFDRLIAQIQFFTGISLLLYLGGIAPYQPDGVYTEGSASLLAKSALILWWTHLAWAIIGVFHIYVRFNRRWIAA